MKIAVAGHSARPGSTHFGYADTFDVYDIANDPPTLVDVRRLTPHCGEDGGDRNRLAFTADLLLDCVAVLASDIGPCAVDALSVRGILPVIHAGSGLDGAGGILLAIRNHVAGGPSRQILSKEPVS